mmetsp:Transcript_75543/g.216300  ORF Transcript_75543/g.216300 Transcript_75543/m.216300 type:complete len:255 (-) Transcript_75543:1466-2230(-)
MTTPTTVRATCRAAGMGRVVPRTMGRRGCGGPTTSKTRSPPTWPLRSQGLAAGGIPERAPRAARSLPRARAPGEEAVVRRRHAAFRRRRRRRHRTAPPWPASLRLLGPRLQHRPAELMAKIPGSLSEIRGQHLQMRLHHPASEGPHHQQLLRQRWRLLAAKMMIHGLGTGILGLHLCSRTTGPAAARAAKAAPWLLPLPGEGAEVRKGLPTELPPQRLRSYTWTRTAVQGSHCSGSQGRATKWWRLMPGLVSHL